jgi:hypothetical protein
LKDSLSGNEPSGEDESDEVEEEEGWEEARDMVNENWSEFIEMKLRINCRNDQILNMLGWGGGCTNIF